MKEKMSKNEFFNEIIRHFQDDVKSAKNDTFPSYTEKEAKELLETARERDLKELSRIWEYLVKKGRGIRFGQ